jgi:hypothetical protein
MTKSSDSTMYLHGIMSGGVFNSAYTYVGIPGFFVIASVLATLGLIFYRLWFEDKRLRSLPPKVPGLPIINQTFYHMQDDLATNAIKWTREYGEIYRTRTGTTDWIWLNSGEAIKEIIDRKSAIYSSRLLNPMGFEAASGGKRVVFMPRGKQWRTIRGIIHKLLTPKAAKSYAPIQSFEAKQLSVDLLDTPQGNCNHSSSLHFWLTVHLQTSTCTTDGTLPV